MKATVASMESMCQSSVQSLPRNFGDKDSRLVPLPFTKNDKQISEYDGGSELDAMRKDEERGTVFTDEQKQILEDEDEESWKRPLFHVRDADGIEVTNPNKNVPRQSVYAKRLDEFSVL